jgi:hypothetical protein
MSLFDTLLGIFTDQDTQEAYQQDPEGFLNQNGFGNVTSQDIQAEMPRVLSAVQGNSGGADQGGVANFGGSGNVVLPAPPAPAYEAGGGYEGGLSGAIESINHYTNVVNLTEQSFEDNDVTNIDDRDTTVDNSVNQNITAFGDVTQDFDNDVVSGDGAVAAGDGSQVNTGDGAVQAGGDIGDATNVSAENANLGDGTIVSDVGGDATLNQGDGDLTQIDDSTIEESAIGAGGTVQSNDIDIDAGDGSSVAFGDGASSSAETQDVDIEGNSGTIQVADEGDQTGFTDNSVTDSFDTEDSFNADLDLTDNSVTDSFDTEDSFDEDHSVTDNSVDTTIDEGDTIVDGGLL